jgi:hypothetical protein
MRLTIDRIMVVAVMNSMISTIKVWVLPNFGVPVFWNSMVPVGTDIVKHFQGISVRTNVYVFVIYVMYRTSIRNIQKIVNLKFFSDFGQYKITI